MIAKYALRAVVIAVCVWLVLFLSDGRHNVSAVITGAILGAVIIALAETSR